MLAIAANFLSAHAFADGCASDAECKAGRVCVAGACQDAAGNCANDRDCPGDLICDSGRCLDRPTVATPPPAAPLPAAPYPPTPWVPARPLVEEGPRVAWEVYGGGGFHDRENIGTGLGWVLGGAAGVRFGSGIGVVALGGFASARNGDCEALATCGFARRLQLAHVGAGVSLHSRAAATTLGLAWATAPGIEPKATGGAFVFRYFYHVVERFSFVIDSTIGLVDADRTSTLSLGLGWTD
jgi:hypothetical protein